MLWIGLIAGRLLWISSQASYMMHHGVECTKSRNDMMVSLAIFVIKSGVVYDVCLFLEICLVFGKSQGEFILVGIVSTFVILTSVSVK
jgi:hypothetical protein